MFFAVISLVNPSKAGAYWPFSTTHAETNPTPLLHDPSLNLLTAPLSTNIDDIINSTALTTSDGTALIPNGDGSVMNTADLSGGDTITTPTSGAISQYTVKAGDSLSQIAQNFGVSVNTILWANNITDPSSIKEGTVLVILPVTGIQHTVRSGETLSTIASKFGADGGEIPKTSPPSSASSSKSSKSKTSSSANSTTKPSSKSTSSSSGKLNYSDATGNPYRGGGGAALHGFFTNPLPGSILTQGLHGLDAVDLGGHNIEGSPILAAAKGTVILSRTGGWNGGYGNYVIIDNGGGIETLYAHMSSTSAQIGETVSAGETIGYVGMTGDATGPHLHFEVRGAQNPFAYCVEGHVCSPE